MRRAGCLVDKTYTAYAEEGGCMSVLVRVEIADKPVEISWPVAA